MGKGIIKKIGKAFLWLIKLSFVLLCLLIWWVCCIPLAKSIIPAFHEQCEYHKFAENFLREKYGERINVYNKRLPLSEMNTGNLKDYKYTFRLHGKTYQFLYYVRVLSDDGDFYGDNAQSDELYQLVDSAIDVIIYESTISDFDRISWRFSDEVVQPDYSLAMRTDMGDTMFMSKYTGDNLNEFPIRISLYWDKETKFDKNQEKLEKIYTNMVRDLEAYDISCEEIRIICEGATDYYITETSEGIKIDED